MSESEPSLQDIMQPEYIWGKVGSRYAVSFLHDLGYAPTSSLVEVELTKKIEAIRQSAEPPYNGNVFTKDHEEALRAGFMGEVSLRGGEV